MPKAPLKLLFWQGLVASMRLNPAASPLLTSLSSSILNSWSFLPLKTVFFTCGLFVRSFLDHFFFLFLSQNEDIFESESGDANSYYRCQRDRLRQFSSRTWSLPGSSSSVSFAVLFSPTCRYWTTQGILGPRSSSCSSPSLHSRGAIFQLLHTGMPYCLRKCWNISIQISVWTALTLMPFPPTTPASLREPHTYLWSVSKMLTPDLLFPHPQHLSL